MQPSKIQKWWRKILKERESLRQELISVRQALNELKMKRIKNQINKDLPLEEENDDVEKEIYVKTGEKINENGLETANFGKFNLKSENQAQEK